MASSFSSFPSPRQGRSVGRWGPLSPCFPFSLCVGGQTGAQNCFRTPGTFFLARSFVGLESPPPPPLIIGRIYVYAPSLSSPSPHFLAKPFLFFSPPRPRRLERGQLRLFCARPTSLLLLSLSPHQARSVHSANTPPHFFQKPSISRRFVLFYRTYTKLFTKCLFNF